LARVVGFSLWVGLLSVTLGPCALAAEVAKQPLPAGPNVFCRTDLSLARREYGRKVMVTAYEQAGMRGPEWDQAALDFLDLYARLLPFEDPAVEQYFYAAQKMDALQCPDPAVNYCIGLAFMNAGKTKEGEVFMRRAVEGFQQAPYPRRTSWRAPIHLANMCATLGGEKEREVNRWLDLGVEWVGEAAAEGGFTGKDLRVFWEHLQQVVSNNASAKRSDQITEAIIAQKGADPWLVHMLSGTREIPRGWAARQGDGAAGDPEKAFRDHFVVAREHLVAAWKLHPDFPEAATAMIEVSMVIRGVPNESERLWFDRAAAAQFDYLPAYTKLRWALQPENAHSVNEVLDFALECLRTERYDTDVPWFYYDTVFFLSGWQGRPDLWRNPEVWARIREMWQRYFKEPWRQPDLPEIQVVYLAVAWRCGAYDEARSMLDQLGGKVPDDAFGRFFTPNEWALGEIYAATGPLAKDVRAAETLYQDGPASDAHAAFTVLRARNTDARADRYLANRVEMARIEAGLESGEWVSVLPKAIPLDGWQVTGGDWSIDPGGASLNAWSTRNAAIVCEARIGGNLEIRGDVETAEPPVRHGCYVGFRVLRRLEEGWSHLAIRNDQQATVQLTGQKMPVVALPVHGVNHFCIQLWHDRLSAYVNGQQVVRDVDSEYYASWAVRRWEAPTMIGLSCYTGGVNEPVRWRKLEIRRLRTAPTGPN
jgi:hypothetical protein